MNNYFLSTRQISPRREIKVKFADGKTFSYLVKEVCQEGDYIVIGHGGRTSYQLGEIVTVSENISENPKYMLKPLLVFSKEPKKADVKSATKLIPFQKVSEIVEQNAYNLFSMHKDCSWEYYPTDILYINILKAITILAFPDLVDVTSLKQAKLYLKKKKTIPSALYKWKFNISNFYLSGLYEGWQEEMLSLELWNDSRIDDLNLGYLEGGDDKPNTLIFESFDGTESLKFLYEDEEYSDAINELVYKSVIVVLIKIGAENMLEAFLSARPPIDKFVDKLLVIAENENAVGCKELLEKYKK